MTERADYYIEKVRYNKDHTKIVWVSVHEDNDTKLGGAYHMLRKKIVSLMRAGKRFMTIFRNSEGKYRRGVNIVTVRVNGTVYIQTDGVGADSSGPDEKVTEKDLLENLPEF